MSGCYKANGGMNCTRAAGHEGAHKFYCDSPKCPGMFDNVSPWNYLGHPQKCGEPAFRDRQGTIVPEDSPRVVYRPPLKARR